MKSVVEKRGNERKQNGETKAREQKMKRRKKKRKGLGYAMKVQISK